MVVETEMELRTRTGRSASPGRFDADDVADAPVVGAAGRLDDAAEPSVAILSLPEAPGALGHAGDGGEPRRRLRWVGWIRRRVFHGESVRKFT